jgi:hypothetical protein
VNASTLDRWLFAAVPTTRLAATRIIIGLFGLLYVILRSGHFASVANLPARDFEPVGVISVLSQPLPGAALYALIALTVLSGAAFVAGFRFRVAGPLYALCLLVLTSYRNSWGMLFHVEHLLVLHTLVLAVSPVAGQWSFDARRSPGPPTDSGWPLRLLCLLTVATYVVAGVAKLNSAGLGWSTGDVLREHIAYDALRKQELGGAGSPLGPLSVGLTWLFPPLAALTLVIEVLAPIALLGRKIGRIWSAAAWSFHVGVLLLMGIFFPYPLLGIAYVPFFDAEKPIQRWLQRRATGSVASS